MVAAVAATMGVSRFFAEAPRAIPVESPQAEHSSDENDATPCPTEGEVEALRRRVQEMESTLVLHQQVRSLEIALKEGTPEAWRADIPEKYHPESVHAALEAALRSCPKTAAFRFDLDCSEPPCLLWSEGVTRLPSNDQPEPGSANPFDLLADCPSWPYTSRGGTGSMVSNPDGTVTILNYDRVGDDTWPRPDEDLNLHKRTEQRTQGRVEEFIEANL